MCLLSFRFALLDSNVFDKIKTTPSKHRLNAQEKQYQTPRLTRKSVDGLLYLKLLMFYCAIIMSYSCNCLLYYRLKLLNFPVGIIQV